jgi:hypothetical protein
MGTAYIGIDPIICPRNPRFGKNGFNLNFLNHYIHISNAALTITKSLPISYE